MSLRNEEQDINSPWGIYVDAFTRRIADAQDEMNRDPNDESIAKAAMVTQEALAVDCNIRHFVRRVGETGRQSGPGWWAMVWKGREPLADPAVKKAVCASDAGNNIALADAAMVLAAGRVEQGATPEDLAREFSREGFCTHRSALLAADAALRHGDDETAQMEFENVAKLAPHVTVSHRRLGEIARRKGNLRDTVRHFEAACATPATSWTLADQADFDVVGMTSSPGWMDLVSYRGRVFAISADEPYAGLLAFGDDIYRVPNSAIFHLWSRHFSPPFKKVKRIIKGAPGIRQLLQSRRERRHAAGIVYKPSTFMILALRLVFRIHLIDDAFRDINLENLIAKIGPEKTPQSCQKTAGPRPWA